MEKKIFLLVLLCLCVIATFIGCHKDPLDLGKTGMLNLSLKQGNSIFQKSTIESFDARVTIYYGADDTVAYNCRFIDPDDDGLFTNDPTVSDCIYIHRNVEFTVGVWSVIQGDTVVGKSDESNPLYFTGDTDFLDVLIVLMSLHPLYSQPTGYENGYGYVDLGLPSGILWAYTNIGATIPTDYGYYYAWGEISTKEIYSWDTYQYCNGDSAALTKYCNDESYGLDGYTDSLTTLDASDDAASVNWGGNWRMPTHDEMQELIDNCDTAWTAQNGKKGMLFTSNENGNSIFFPAAGFREGRELLDDGVGGNYWSKSLDENNTIGAKDFFLSPIFNYISQSSWFRGYGETIRPVCVQSKKK